jgi:hypothetical protein
MEVFMGWICFILLILWAIWMILTNLPRIIGFALKGLAGLLALYVCVEAFALIGEGFSLLSAEVVPGYSFIRSNGWSILWISAGIGGVFIVIGIWNATRVET